MNFVSPHALSSLPWLKGDLLINFLTYSFIMCMGTLYDVPKHLFMREKNIPQEQEERNQGSG